MLRFEPERNNGCHNRDKSWQKWSFQQCATYRGSRKSMFTRSAASFCSFSFTVLGCKVYQADWVMKLSRHTVACCTKAWGSQPDCCYPQVWRNSICGVLSNKAKLRKKGKSFCHLALVVFLRNIITSGGSWWKWPGRLRNFISGWTYRIVALSLAVYNGVSSHSSSPKLLTLVIFSCSYWYIEDIHFSLMNPNPKHERKRMNPTAPIKSMTHNQCHQSEKGESRTQDHSHTKLGTFRSTTKVLLLIWQSLAFYSNRVMAADLGYSHFLWTGTFILFFQMKFKFSKKIQTVYDFIQNLFF